MISRGWIWPAWNGGGIYVGSQVLSLMHRAPSFGSTTLPLVFAQL
jgi:hypothetical protein